MSVPQHLWRFPTREAINRLARRFDLPNESSMQDWEWQVANSKCIDEFLAAYLSEELTEDENFTLMEIILQSFEELEEPLETNSKWQNVLNLLDQNIALHIYSVYYWSDLENENEDDQWRVTTFLRAILEKHKHVFL